LGFHEALLLGWLEHLAQNLVGVEKGTNTVISFDSLRFRERTINYLRRNFRAISAQK
jgi:hypothetical protein